jgi:hypothetical protein
MMLTVLRAARTAHRQFQALPTEEQGRYAADMARIRGLLRELGGTRAVAFVENDTVPDEADGTELTSTTRDRHAVARDLQAATSALLARMSGPSRELLAGEMPRSARLSRRIAVAGISRVRNRKG